VVIVAEDVGRSLFFVLKKWVSRDLVKICVARQNRIGPGKSQEGREDIDNKESMGRTEGD